MLQFKCPHCKKAYKVKDEYAGKKATCSACKQSFTIPKPKPAPAPPPVPAPAVDVEAEAAAALTDEPRPAAPVKEATTIDFHCPYCDEEVHIGISLAGKQAPCPSCRRIIKVPMPVKEEPKDWRKVDTRSPLAAHRDGGPAPEGAWGTAVSTTVVSREALVETDALPEDREPWTWKQKLSRAGVGLIVVGALVLGTVYGLRYWTHVRQEEAFERALAYVKSDSGKPKLKPEAAAALHRALGEFYLRAHDAEKAHTHLQQARALLIEGEVSPEREAFLVELALTQVDLGLVEAALTQADLGGDPKRFKEAIRLTWDKTQKDLWRTLQHLRSAEARAEALRQVSRKLIGKGQEEQAKALANLPSSSTDETPETLALVGLELAQAGHKQLAEDLATQALQFYGPAREDNKRRPVAPSLVALGLFLNKPKILPGTAPEDPENILLGSIEGQARQGNTDSAKKMLPAKVLSPLLRLKALVAGAAGAIANDQPEAARPFLEEAATLVESEKGLSVSPWLVLRLARLAVQAGLAERVLRLTKAIPNDPLRGWVQLEVVRSQLAGTHEQADDTLADGVDKQAPAHVLALEVVARHNARYGSSGDVIDAADAWQPETLRPFGYIGVALGLQDRK